MIYFDSAATSFQKPPEVEAAIHRALHSCASVGRGGYPMAMEAAKAVYDCRKKAAGLFDAEEEQVVFTMNATHGLNVAIASLVKPGDRVVISGFEHNAVTRPLHALGAKVQVAGRKIFDPEDTLKAFEEALQEPAAAVVCTQVSNVFGYVLPVERMAELCGRKNVPLVIDASQGAGILPLSLRKTGAAFIAMPGHKGLYGPQGTGLLLCGREAEPLLYGGTGSNSAQQEMPDFLPDRLEAGTHNVCGIAGLSAGLDFVSKKGVKTILHHERELLRLLLRLLREQEGLELFEGQGQTGVLSLRIKNTDCEEAAQRLSRHGVAVRSGLHCAPFAHESAGTLDSGTLRVSFSAFNTRQEVRYFASLCKKLFSGKEKPQFTTCY